MPPVLTVSQIVAMIKGSLERTFASVDIEGEISNWSLYPSSGHAYFVLKDAGAQIRAVLFARVPCECRDRLGDGRRVKVRGTVTMYPQRGECQIFIKRLKIAGEGELMAKYLELKAKLEAEGLFAPQRKKPLPAYPRRIGLVTSPTGAVVHDMCRVLTRRFPNIHILVYPSSVQGADASRTLIAGVEYFARNPWADLVIVARGGGSFEDLFCFNDEALVRAIAACPVPVISAVGHETDYTLCDFVADRRAGTPSIAAEIAVPVLDEVVKRIAQASAKMAYALRSRGDVATQHIDRLSQTLSGALSARLKQDALRLSHLSQRLTASLAGATQRFDLRLGAVCAALPKAAARMLERAGNRLERAASRLALLSPYSVLERGYSLTTDSAGRVVKDASTLSPGDLITTRLAAGCVKSRVEKS